MNPGIPHDSSFPETQWTLVGRVHLPGKDGALAMDELFRRYWFPVYSFLRSTGSSTHDAEDLTQGFFQRQVEDGIFHVANPLRGKLRALVLVALRNFRRSQHSADTAVKRGGKMTIVSFDAEEAEERYANGPVDTRDPEKIYFAAWAHGIIERTRKRLRLRESFQSKKTVESSLALEPYLDPETGTPPYPELAALLGVAEGTLRQHLHRLRLKFADLLRDEISRTVDSPDEIEAELQWLLNAIKAE